MKKFILLLAGIAAAAGCVLITRSRATAPRSVDDLAHSLQDAWADHHTIV